MNIKSDKPIDEEQKIDKLHDRMHKKFENEKQYNEQKRQFIDYAVPIGIVSNLFKIIFVYSRILH